MQPGIIESRVTRHTPLPAPASASSRPVWTTCSLPSSIRAAVPIRASSTASGWWQDHSRRRYTPIIADTAAAKVEMTILRSFREAGEQGLTQREAQRLTHAHRQGTARWNAAFDALRTNGNLVALGSLSSLKSEKS